jgi:FkbM family methyltransferase
MMKKWVVPFLNEVLSPFGARVVAERESGKEPGDGANPSAGALRRRLFDQLARKGFYPNHILDVGAHKGEWSRDALATFPESLFTLIEPQVEMKPDLDRFCSGARRARWILAGAGAVAGELPFTIARRSDSSSFAFSEADTKKWGIERRIVPVVTLDSLCQESTVPIPQMVKIDAEGFDLEVIRGATKLIGKTELFFLELPLFDYWPNQTFHTIIGVMRDHGYEPYDVTDLNRRPSDGALALVEMAFARKTGMLREHHGW